MTAAFPAFRDMKVAESWGGVIDVTPDAVPVISAVDTLPGFFIATGFTGHGFGIGPGAGRLMAELVTGETPVVDPTPFRYSRFTDGSRPQAFATRLTLRLCTGGCRMHCGLARGMTLSHRIEMLTDRRKPWPCASSSSNATFPRSARWSVSSFAARRRNPMQVLNQLGPDIQWVESYVAADKTFCVYLAKDEDIIRKHAEISGFPATKITEVRKMIDPTTEHPAS